MQSQVLTFESQDSILDPGQEGHTRPPKMKRHQSGRRVAQADKPRRATILDAGFMMAASAEMGQRFTALPAVMSTITSSPPWQTQTYLSLCREHVWNLMDSGATAAVCTSWCIDKSRQDRSRGGSEHPQQLKESRIRSTIVGCYVMLDSKEGYHEQWLHLLDCSSVYFHSLQGNLSG